MHHSADPRTGITDTGNSAVVLESQALVRGFRRIIHENISGGGGRGCGGGDSNDSFSVSPRSCNSVLNIIRQTTTTAPPKKGTYRRRRSDEQTSFLAYKWTGASYLGPRNRAAWQAARGTWEERGSIKIASERHAAPLPTAAQGCMRTAYSLAG